MAPAGDRTCAVAAVENGADAVYFGLDAGFNARARAANIALEELDELMAFLHGRGVKGYVTLNTLVFSDELAAVERLVRRIAGGGVDAVLVQDIGAARLIKAVCPDLPLHASTQMTLTSAETIAAVESLGFERVVLARELALDEIRQIARDDHAARSLCPRCVVRGLLGPVHDQRIARRPQRQSRPVAQACRLPYELICDGQDVDLGHQQYLLSPQDLAAYDLIPELVAAGVTAFKIEGRLKTPEYVANITRHYRRALDAAMAGPAAEFTPRDVEEMELSFSRGFSHGWLDGCDHKLLVPAISSAKRGVLVGRIRSIARNRVAVELSSSIKRGDGIVFEGSRAGNKNQQAEQGGRVFEVFQAGRSLEEPVAAGVVELALAHGAIDFAALHPGQNVWKTDDPQLTSRLRKTFSGARPERRVSIDLHIAAAVGQPLLVRATTDSGIACQVVSPGPLEAAQAPADGRRGRGAVRSPRCHGLRFAKLPSPHRRPADGPAERAGGAAA